MTRVLIADKFERAGVGGLKDIGCEVIERPEVTVADLPALLKEIEPQILVVRSKRVAEAALAASGRLSLVIRAGAGIDTIDVDAASKLGIFVSNCPGKNAVAVAELVMGLLLACDRRIPDQVIALRGGQWEKGEYAKARGLLGRTFGIVGLGQIGREVARRAQAFGMKVAVWSRQLTIDDAKRLDLHFCESPIEVARVSDAVTLNVAANAETNQLVNAEFLAAMKPGAYLINTSRGSIVDEEALLHAIHSKGIRAGLDVYQDEPAGGSGAFDSALAKSPGVYGTHHIGASTDQAQLAIAHEVIRIVGEYMSSGRPLHCVNRLVRSSATHVLSVRHQNRPGVLAQVFQVLVNENINVEEVENIAYHGAEAASARIHVSGVPSDEAIAEMQRVNPHIISVDLSRVES